jgi:DNA-binding transcriptional LysR family regulator
MDLRSLRHVVALSRHLSFRKAAEDLRLSQSALSRSIQAVERRAQTRLFDRDRSGVRLTAVGRAFVDRAEMLLRDADDLDRQLRRFAVGAQGEVVFGMAPVLAAALAPAVLSETLNAVPDLRCRVFVRGVDALLPLLECEQIEFLVCSERLIPDETPVKGTLLGRFPTSLLVRAGHPLLTGPVEGRSFPLITSAVLAEQGVASTAVEFLEGPPHLILEDHAALLRITETSDAVWLSSSFAVADAIAQGRLAALPLPAALQGRADGRFRAMMYHLERRSLSPAALRLRDQFQSRIRKLGEMLPS